MEIQDHELAARTTDPIGACTAGVVWRAIGVIVLLAVAASVSVAQTQEGQQAQDEDQAADFVRLDLNATSGDDFRTIPGVGNRLHGARVHGIPPVAASVELSDADIEQAGTMLTGFDE